MMIDDDLIIAGSLGITIDRQNYILIYLQLNLMAIQFAINDQSS